MDERLWICLWMVGGGGLGAVLGGAFGALTGVLYAQSGGAAGTRLARRLVESFLDAPERQTSSLRRAALIGAADGFLFLGILGLVAGALLGVSGRAANELLVPAVVGSVLLVGGAIVFGLLAYALTHHRARFLSGFAGGILGYEIAAILLGSVYGVVGFVSGFSAGWLLYSALRRASPTFRQPRVEKPFSQPRPDTNTDITNSPPPRPGSDAFRKPDVDGKP